MSEVYDYIVVGAGSAGCVVANRLSADPKNRVLLLEAGGKDRNPWIHVPVGYYRTMYHPDISWGYETEPDAGVNDRVMVWPRGRVLGGSSSINGLLYVRGQHQDYDHWRQLGNEGWGWDDVLPFFKKSESYERGGNDFRGGDGPLSVSDIADRRPVCEAFLDACEEVGIPRNEDYNGAVQDGAGYYQTTSRNGRRCSAAVAYLNPIKSRKNLHIETRALASKLEMTDGRASGITYLRDGIEYKAEASREIVLCGGAINSPQLLQLSGIGPAEHLRSVGIPVQHELPGVGDDLQDHFQVRAIYELDGLESLNTDVGNPLKRIAMGLQYALTRKGPLTISAGQVYVFTKTRAELETPDIQFHFIPFSADKPGQLLHPFPGVTSSICQLRPESRGSIMVKSGDPHDYPSIKPNYLSTEGDRRTIIDGMKLNRKISQSPAFSKHLKAEYEPGLDRADDDGLLAYAREKGGTIFHPTSTCRMGADPKAVVDARLRVHGIAGLRVADCSIMPTVVSGNTNAPAMMIGEKASAMILEDNRAR